MAKNILVHFEHGRFYHVFNRTNNGETLFREDRNRKYFLDLCRSRLNGFVDIYAMALLRNHFHIAMCIRDDKQIIKYLKSLKKSEISITQQLYLETAPNERNLHSLISKQFSRIFNSYTQAINKKYKRTGHLFHSPFKRAMVQSDAQLSHLIYYIHHNSRKHGIVERFDVDKWHSYQSILKQKEGRNPFHNLVDRCATINHFGSIKVLKDFHLNASLNDIEGNVIIE